MEFEIRKNYSAKIIVQVPPVSHQVKEIIEMCPPRRSIVDAIGSGVTSLRELNWETAGIEQQVRTTFTNFGSRVSNFVGPTSVQVRDYAREKPITAICLGAFIAACAFPIFIFVSFALITLGIGLIGFLCIEGTILSFGLFILGWVLLTISFIGASIGAGLFACYFGYSKSRQLIDMILTRILPAQSKASSPSTNGSLKNGKARPTAPEEDLSGTESANHETEKIVIGSLPPVNL